MRASVCLDLEGFTEEGEAVAIPQGKGTLARDDFFGRFTDACRTGIDLTM